MCDMNRLEQGVRKVHYTTQSDCVSDHGGRGHGLVQLDEASVLDLSVYLSRSDSRYLS